MPHRAKCRAHLAAHIRSPEARKSWEYSDWYIQVESIAAAIGGHRWHPRYEAFNWYGQWDHGATALQAFQRYLERAA